MGEEERLFFADWPMLLPIYERLREKLAQKYSQLRVKVSKTQISFYNRRMFAMVSLPWRKVKGRPKVYLLVSFGLPVCKEASRIEQAVEAYANRWTHHVVVQRVDEIDSELLEWLDEAYSFSMVK